MPIKGPSTPPPPVSRPASRSYSQAESENNRRLLALAKQELILIKEEVVTQDFKKKHDAVLNYIRMKSIAKQLINNTYTRIAKIQEYSLKIDARDQCLSEEGSPDDRYLSQKEDPFDIFWKRNFIIYANGSWNVGDSYSPPASPPKSPTQDEDEEVWVVPRRKKKNKRIEEKTVEKRTISQVKEKKRVAFPDDGVDQIAKHFNREDNYMILPNPRDNYTESPTKKNDGQNATPEVALAKAIEIWYAGGFTGSSKLYSEFWNHPKIQEFKKQGFLGDFGKIIKNSIKDYDAGKKVSFKSKSPFKMDSALKVNLEKMLFQYSKKYPTNAEAKPFIMPVTYS